MDPGCIEIVRNAFRGGLLEALMVGFIGEEQRARPWVIDDGLLNEAD
jgi:hypothetical protein